MQDERYQLIEDAVRKGKVYGKYYLRFGFGIGKHCYTKYGIRYNHLAVVGCDFTHHIICVCINAF